MKKLISILFILQVILCGCSIAPDQAGTSEQGNARMAATVYRSDGRPAAGATVRIRQAGYVEGIVLNKQLQSKDNLKTDSLGSFKIDSLDTGSYSIEVTDNSKEAVLLKCKLTKDVDRKVIAFTDTLRPFAALKGKVDYNPALDRRFVQVEGLERLVEVDTSGNYYLSDLPQGSYSLRIVSINQSIEPAIINDVSVHEGSLTLAPYNGWIFSKTVFLNTTASGAGTTGNVYNFPVLIRLTTGNFNFNEAKANGEDFRVYKSENDPTALPFEVERWDSSAGLAEIWVKVDTVYGNSIKSSFVMKWGNPSVQAGNSNGSAVFDTAAGFAGVWHLGPTAGGIAFDATVNGNNGTATATTTATGAIGMAQMFNGTSSLIQAAGPSTDKLNFPDNGTFTVSAWVNANAVDSLFHGIIYKSNLQYGLQIRPENVWNFNTFVDKTGWEESNSAASANSWHFLTGVRNGTRQYLYVDGSCVDSTKALDPSELTRVYDTSFQIGHCPDGGLDPDRYFSGVIDEVRISSVASSTDWIKLCYMNQKQQDALVKW